VRLEASTKPPIHNLFHEFLINMAFTMACLNFKKGLEMAFGPLGVTWFKHTAHNGDIVGSSITFSATPPSPPSQRCIPNHPNLLHWACYHLHTQIETLLSFKPPSINTLRTFYHIQENLFISNTLT
jgi:hypothetical protein